MTTTGRSAYVKARSTVGPGAQVGSSATTGRSEAARASGVNEPGTQVGSAATVGRSQVVRIPGVTTACDWWVDGAGQANWDWPSEPRWGLLDYPAVGWPSGGCEVPRVLHWSSPALAGPYYYFAKSDCTRGTVEEWFPADTPYPWDDSLALMFAQESGEDVYLNVNMWLTGTNGNALDGDCWFGIYRNSFLIAAGTFPTTEGALSWNGTVHHLDRFHIVYQTCVPAQDGGWQGAEFYMHGHRI